MFVKPVNKMLVVKKEPEPEKKNDFGIIVPDMTPKVSNIVVTLIAAETNSLYEKYEGQKILVRSNMIEDFDIKGSKITLAPENSVIAVIAESDLL